MDARELRMLKRLRLHYAANFAAGISDESFMLWIERGLVELRNAAKPDDPIQETIPDAGISGDPTNAGLFDACPSCGGRHAIPDSCMDDAIAAHVAEQERGA